MGPNQHSTHYSDILVALRGQHGHCQTRSGLVCDNPPIDWCHAPSSELCRVIVAWLISHLTIAHVSIGWRISLVSLTDTVMFAWCWLLSPWHVNSFVALDFLIWISAYFFGFYSVAGVALLATAHGLPLKWNERPASIGGMWWSLIAKSSQALGVLRAGWGWRWDVSNKAEHQTERRRSAQMKGTIIHLAREFLGQGV